MRLAALVVTVAALGLPAPAHADQQRCGESGDWCVTLTRHAGHAHLSVRTFSFRDATVCVRRRGATRRACRALLLAPRGNGLYASGFDYRGRRGLYTAAFYGGHGRERFKLATITFRAP